MLMEKAGIEVETIPSSCCGMAGAFGYEKEHYDLSMRIGELRLFEDIRKKKGDLKKMNNNPNVKEIFNYIALSCGTSLESFERVNEILKRSSHITVIVSDGKEV